MSNFSFEPLKLKLATNNIIIPLENGVANLTNAETSAKIMLAGKELFPVFDESIGGERNYIKSFTNSDWEIHSRATIISERELVHVGNTGQGGVNRSTLIIELSDAGAYAISGYTKGSPDSVIVLRPIVSGVGVQQTLYLNDSENYELFKRSFSITNPVKYQLEIGGKALPTEGLYFKELTLVKGTIPADWSPAPEDVLQLSTLTWYNCSAAIVGDLIKITSHKPGTTRGWVDVTVNYGNLSNTKRLNWSVEGVEPYKPLGTLLTMNNRGIKL